MTTHLAVTFLSNEISQDIQLLIGDLRKALDDQHLTVLQAPKNLDYPFQFPVVTLSADSVRVRKFGPDAINLLRDFLQHGSKEAVMR